MDRDMSCVVLRRRGHPQHDLPAAVKGWSRWKLGTRFGRQRPSTQRRPLIDTPWNRRPGVAFAATVGSTPEPMLDFAPRLVRNVLRIGKTGGPNWLGSLAAFA
ncbi:hypothetical protein BN1708_002377 [Verticillium longisporum]|uniref:Uncharacterized protein n=1 Tax=Verticillium longisporum TaxID=100787 RepID=A0A0G4KQ85_VERLO|nr:hypothetical protein BN1708_002377 [Verticillium longisporum]